MARILRDTVTPPRRGWSQRLKDLARRVLVRIWPDLSPSRRLERAGRDFLREASREYGGIDTIHGSTLLDVEVHNGQVVSVWFRCQPLPFRQCDVTDSRAEEMIRMVGSSSLPALTAVKIDDSRTPSVQVGF